MKIFRSNSDFGVGLVFILAGLTFLAGNTGILPHYTYEVLTSWPMILVAIGIITLFKGNLTATVILWCIASFFLLPDIIPGLTMHNIWKFWPFLLVIIGVTIIFKKKKSNNYQPPIITERDEAIDEVAIFGARVLKVESQNFKGGEITAIFGGVEVQLTRANISDEGAVIEMTAIFGGVKLIVPRDWVIKVEVVSIFGGFTDKRLYNSPAQPQSKTLYIKGVTVFGGGELISY